MLGRMAHKQKGQSAVVGERGKHLRPYGKHIAAKKERKAARKLLVSAGSLKPVVPVVV